MSLLVILAIGAGLGWIAGLVTRARTGHTIAANVALGMAGAAISGGMGSAAVLEGITPASLGATCVGSLLLLVAVNLVWRLPRRPERRHAKP